MANRSLTAIAVVAVFVSLCIVGVAADEPEAAPEAAPEAVTLDPLYRSPLRVDQIQVQSADTLTYRDEAGTHDATYRIVDGKTVEISMTIDDNAVTKTFTITPYGLRPESGPSLYGKGGYVVKKKRSSFFNRNESMTEQIIARENAYTKTAYYVYGDYLGGTYAGKTLVIIGDNGGVSSEREKLIMDALNEGLADRMKVKIVKLKPAPVDPADAMMMGPEFMLTPDAFESILNEHVPGYATTIERKAVPAKIEGNPRDTVVLSLMGLPMEMNAMPWWKIKAAGRPHLALMNAMVFGMKEHITAGRVDAVLTYNPNAIYDPDATFPASMMDAFRDRYIFITPANAVETAKRYPELFGDD